MSWPIAAVVCVALVVAAALVAWRWWLVTDRRVEHDEWRDAIDRVTQRLDDVESTLSFRR